MVTSAGLAGSGTTMPKVRSIPGRTSDGSLSPIFEVTAAAAVGAALRSYDAGRRAIET